MCIRDSLEAVGSPAVKVYYDVYNAHRAGYDYVSEIKQLGNRICQFHFKEGPRLLGAGAIDWQAVARAINHIGYRGWIVLETSSPHELVRDSRTNAQYVRRLFKQG